MGACSRRALGEGATQDVLATDGTTAILEEHNVLRGASGGGGAGAICGENPAGVLGIGKGSLKLQHCHGKGLKYQ